MKIRVESVFSVGPATWVEFSFSLSGAPGRGEAQWVGVAPDFNREYFVELELTAPIEVAPAMMKTPLLDASREECRLRGIVEGEALRIGDSLVLLARPSVVGWASVRSGPLRLYDNNL
jgi:hypothetical protein